MPSPGDLLSRFRLVEKIGEGGMGEVWRATDTSLDRDVALKILPAELTQDPERLASFEGEAKAVAALNHPNIVTIHSVEQVDGVHFIAMELVRGKPLSRLIPPSGFHLDQFLELAIPIADAVRAAHEKEVVHRDLKPANVMLGEEERVKVLDFGLAQIRGNEKNLDPTDLPTRTLTTGSEIRGTLPYMSPEQLQDKPLDPRSDVFSLGVMFYEMATGRRPFGGDTAVELIAAILRDYPRPITEFNREKPDELQRIVAHSMQKDRERRMQSAQDLRNRLEALQTELRTSPLSQETIRGATEQHDLTSVAVLPLENHSSDPTQDFFSDGMTEALITGLAKIEGLKVISRTSVMRYKKTAKPLKEIASELGVGAVIEGSVLRIDDRVRITAQLINARTDEHIWAESYDRQIQDLFALQSEVAQAIACQVRVKLTAQDEQRLGDQRTIDPEAHEAYLKGRHFWYKRTPDDVRKGLTFFEQSARIDPTYAPAWTGIADSYVVDGGDYLGHRVGGGLRQGERGGAESGPARRTPGRGAYVAGRRGGRLRLGLGERRGRVPPRDRAQPELRHGAVLVRGFSGTSRSGRRRDRRGEAGDRDRPAVADHQLHAGVGLLLRAPLRRFDPAGAQDARARLALRAGLPRARLGPGREGTVRRGSAVAPPGLGAVGRRPELPGAARSTACARRPEGRSAPVAGRDDGTRRVGFGRGARPGNPAYRARRRPLGTGLADRRLRSARRPRPLHQGQSPAGRVTVRTGIPGTVAAGRIVGLRPIDDERYVRVTSGDEMDRIRIRYCKEFSVWGDGRRRAPAYRGTLSASRMVPVVSRN